MLRGVRIEQRGSGYVGVDMKDLTEPNREVHVEAESELESTRKIGGS
jgi:hypothetical protein